MKNTLIANVSSTFTTMIYNVKLVTIKHPIPICIIIFHFTTGQHDNIHKCSNTQKKNIPIDYSLLRLNKNKIEKNIILARNTLKNFRRWNTVFFKK